MTPEIKQDAVNPDIRHIELDWNDAVVLHSALQYRNATNPLAERQALIDELDGWSQRPSTPMTYSWSVYERDNRLGLIHSALTGYSYRLFATQIDEERPEESCREFSKDEELRIADTMLKIFSEENKVNVHCASLENWRKKL